MFAQICIRMCGYMYMQRVCEYVNALDIYVMAHNNAHTCTHGNILPLTFAHSRAHAHTRTYKRMHAYTPHAHAHINTPMHALASVRARTRAHSHTLSHTNAHSWLYRTTMLTTNRFAGTRGVTFLQVCVRQHVVYYTYRHTLFNNVFMYIHHPIRSILHIHTNIYI